MRSLNLQVAVIPGSLTQFMQAADTDGAAVLVLLYDIFPSVALKGAPNRIDVIRQHVVQSIRRPHALICPLSFRRWLIVTQQLMLLT